MVEIASAAYLMSLPKAYYPWFDFCHIVLTVLGIRKEAGRAFGWDHPLATWISCLIACFAGSFVANPLLGKPVFAAFGDEYLFTASSIVFLLVFFCPGDLFYKLMTIKPIYAAICVVKEIYRAKKIASGISDGSKAFSDSKILIPAVVGILKGNGSAFAAPITRALRGTVDMTKTEFMKPSTTTKACATAALAFLLIEGGSGNDLVYSAIVGFFVSLKLASVFDVKVEPFKPAEDFIYGLLRAMDNSDRVKTD